MSGPRKFSDGTEYCGDCVVCGSMHGPQGWCYQVPYARIGEGCGYETKCEKCGKADYDDMERGAVYRPALFKNKHAPVMRA